MWAGRGTRGRTGVNTECKYLLLRYAFETLQCIRAQLRGDGRNLRSQRAVERVGGVKEGVLRKAQILHDGHERYVVVYSLLDEALQFGVDRVFAMTLQESFFHKLGFHTVNIAEFPQKIATDCAGCARRNACAEIAVVRDLGENKNWRS